MLRVRVTNLQFSDGTAVGTPPEAVVLLVGPNSPGKSRALKDLNGLVREASFAGRTLLRVELEKSVSGDPHDWIKSNIPSRRLPDGDERLEVQGWGSVHAVDVGMNWCASLTP